MILYIYDVYYISFKIQIHFILLLLSTSYLCVFGHVQLHPITDLDNTASLALEDTVQRWQCAKTAFIILLRSWVGLLELTSDEMGLSAIVRMLADSKVNVKPIYILTYILTDMHTYMNSYFA
jgi:hypothetical protein